MKILFITLLLLVTYVYAAPPVKGIHKEPIMPVDTGRAAKRSIVMPDSDLDLKSLIENNTRKQLQEKMVSEPNYSFYKNRDLYRAEAAEKFEDGYNLKMNEESMLNSATRTERYLDMYGQKEFKMENAIAYDKGLAKLPGVEKFDVDGVSIAYTTEGMNELKEGDYILAREIPEVFYENPYAGAHSIVSNLAGREKLISSNGYTIRGAKGINTTVTNYVVEKPTMLKSISFKSHYPFAGHYASKYGAPYKVTKVNTVNIEKGEFIGKSYKNVSLTEATHIPSNAKVYRFAGGYKKAPIITKEELLDTSIPERLRVDIRKYSNCICQ